MEASKFNDEVNKIAFYTDCFIFACLFTVELWVAIRLRFNIDKAGILTLLLHLFASLTRIFRSYLGTYQGLMVVAGITIWISLHYFTFEMFLIKITLTADDY
jgi:hypothetical protein